MDLKSLIMADLNFIVGKDRLKDEFKAHIPIIRETQYVLKLAFEPPFPNSNTTYGQRYVRLSKNYPNLGIIERCSILIHEAVHEMQYDRYGGSLGFYLRYLVLGHRGEMEDEAYTDQNRWLYLFGKHL